MNRNQTPARLRHTVALAVGLGCSSAAVSVGLGPIQVNSSLGQPMSATIRVDGLNAAAAKGATVQLASAAAYRARGIELLPSHQKLHFTLVPSGKGYVIRVTSSSSIREPFVNFLLTITSNGSTITREYAAFFNPDPLMEAEGGTQALAVVEQDRAKGKSVDVPIAKKKEKVAKELKEKEILSAATSEREVATRDAKNNKNKKIKETRVAERKQPTPLRAANPDAEGWGGHGLATGTRQSAPVTADNGEGGYSRYSSQVKPGSIAIGSAYGPVKANETLFSIANAARPSESVSIQQMMRAIYNANRKSFAHNNMGNLMVGSTLLIPEPGAATMPPTATPPIATGDQLADNGNAKTKKTSTKNNKNTSAKAATILADNDKKNDSVSTNQLATNEEANGKEPLPNKDVAAVTATEMAQAETPSTANNLAPLDGNALTLDKADSLLANNTSEVEQTDKVVTEVKPEASSVVTTETVANETPVVASATTQVAQNEPETAPTPLPEMKSEPVVAVAHEDRVSTGLPLPLLAAAGTGVLALGGATAFILAKRKRREDDSMDEFSQEEINRMVSEMESQGGNKVNDDLSAVKATTAPASADIEGLERLNAQLAELEELNNQFSGLPKYRDEDDSHEPHSAEELPDDFFKDLDLPTEETDVAKNELQTPVSSVNEHAKDEAEDDLDFFSDLEEFAKEPSSEKVDANSLADDDFDFFSMEDNESEAEAKVVPVNEPKNKEMTAVQSEEGDDFDFISFVEESPAEHEKSAVDDVKNTADNEIDDLDFLSLSDDDSVSPAPEHLESINPAMEISDTEADDLDFFASDTESEDENLQMEATRVVHTAISEPVVVAVEKEDDNALDFFTLEDEPKAEPATSIAATVEDESDVLDFFSDDFAITENKSDIDEGITVESAGTVKTTALPQEIDNFFAKDDKPIVDHVIAQKTSSVQPQPSSVDVEAMEINLDMATSFIVMGKAEKARSWLDEVLESGSESQKIRARNMLEQLEKV
ncbi:MAG: FimV/HubP family polar landmark protein [Cardiobacteriaceae bacterium]|nr:FimV/HubP family polar landmark protein [Cardiobacteriaceae bacterium]